MLVWYAQELQSSCVAACVRMVLGGLGVQITEADVRRLIKHSRLGVSLSSAQVQLSKAGTTALVHTDWSLDDLREALRAGSYPIVGIGVICLDIRVLSMRLFWSKSRVRQLLFSTHSMVQEPIATASRLSYQRGSWPDGKP